MVAILFDGRPIPYIAGHVTQHLAYNLLASRPLVMLPTCSCSGVWHLLSYTTDQLTTGHQRTHFTYPTSFHFIHYSALTLQHICREHKLFV